MDSHSLEHIQDNSSLWNGTLPAAQILIERQGTSKHARAFNCTQRSHQQIFETFPQTCLLSMVGAVHYPIATAVTLSAYCVGRYTMSMGYAGADDGDAQKRYSHPLAKFTWIGYISTMFVAAVSGVSFLLGKPAL